MAVLQVVAVPFPPFHTPPGHPGGGGRGRYKLPTSVEARRHNLSPGGLVGIWRRVGWDLEEGWLGSGGGLAGIWRRVGWDLEGGLAGIWRRVGWDLEEGWLGSGGGLAGIWEGWLGSGRRSQPTLLQIPAQLYQDEIREKDCPVYLVLRTQHHERKRQRR